MPSLPMEVPVAFWLFRLLRLYLHGLVQFVEFIGSERLALLEREPRYHAVLAHTEFINQLGKLSNGSQQL